MNLKSYLEICEIGRNDFAISIGVSRSTISHYLSGRRCPNAEIALKIVRKTKGKVTLEDMIQYYQENYRPEFKE